MVRIKTDKGTEVEFSPEELRHFKINTAKELCNFIEEFEKEKRKIGFSAKKNKK